MVINQIWYNANPELRGHLRRANEERSAAFYAAWRAVTAPLRRFIEALRRVRRKRETYGALSHLNDRQLQDIGFSRSEIGSIAQAIAAELPEAGVTIAELRQTRSFVAARRDADVVELPQSGQQGRTAARPPAGLFQPDRIAS